MPATALNGQAIINKFFLYTDDTSELADSDALALANDKYRLVLMEQPWEFLRRKKTGTVESDGAITVPADFDELMENHSEDATLTEPVQKVVFIGSGLTPYFVVPMGQRNETQYANICWFDPSDNKIKFAQSPGSGASYEYDYKLSPDDILIGTSPLLPADYHQMLVFAMLIDDEVIQKSEKARSNFEINAAHYARYLKNLKLRDARFKIP